MSSTLRGHSGEPPHVTGAHGTPQHGANQGERGREVAPFIFTSSAFSRGVLLKTNKVVNIKVKDKGAGL